MRIAGKIMKLSCKTISTLLVLSGSILFGCAAKGPIYTSPPAPDGACATVVLYREKGYTGSLLAHTYQANGKQIGALGPGNYYYFYVDPGDVHMKMHIATGSVEDDKHAEGKEIQFAAKSGEVYFVREGISFRGLLPIGPIVLLMSDKQFGIIDPVEAKAILKEYMYFPAGTLYKTGDNLYNVMSLCSENTPKDSNGK